MGSFWEKNAELGIYKGPRIRLNIIILKSNALVVDSGNKQKRNDNQNPQHKKSMISINILHGRFYRTASAIVTVRAHDLWEDGNIVQGNNTICTPYKIMKIPSHSRGKGRNSIVWDPLDEIQVDTVPNPEPMGQLLESRYAYFSILCDRYSKNLD